MAETISTPLTKLLGIKYPVILAGMNVVAGPELAAAVSNCGGLGIIGGVGYTPKVLRMKVAELKEYLDSPDLPFGIDLLLPQVGGNARKTNVDYTQGKLPELIDIVIESGATLFVSAVGIPPKWAVEKLHKNGIPVMNMIGSVRHVQKALDAGADMICAQGGEGGGHTGEVATTVLLPQVVDMCSKKTSALTGGPVMVVGAGGIYAGRGLAMALSLGASAVWVGTRFIASTESGAPQRHIDAVVGSTSESTMRTIIYTGRPLRIVKNDYALDWENNRQQEIIDLTTKGTIPVYHDAENRKDEEGAEDMLTKFSPLLMGQACGPTYDVKPAKEIVTEMVGDAIKIFRGRSAAVTTTPANPTPQFRALGSKL